MKCPWPFGAAGAVCMVFCGCVTAHDGLEPPARQLYFPTGLAVSPAGAALYVVNSDFDLQFNGGTVQTLDLARLRRLVPPLWQSGSSCEQAGLRSTSSADQILYPGSCSPIDLANPPDGHGSLLRQLVKIGAFATDVSIVLRPAQDHALGARLLVPVRGDPSLTWLDIDDDRTALGGAQNFRLECGQQNNANRCSASYRAGTDPNDNTRSLTMPEEPLNLAVSDQGEAIVVSHQTTGAVSLFLNGWSGGAVQSSSLGCSSHWGTPSLWFVLGGLPSAVTGVAALPVPRLARLHPELSYQPGFLVTFANAAEVDLVRYFNDCAATPSRPFLTRSNAIGLSVNASGVESRSIAVDARARTECEDRCDASDQACLTACAGLPVSVYLANRSPPSLLIGESISNVSRFESNDLLRFYDQIPLSVGASRVQIGTVVDANGNRKTRVFVLCFDARIIYVYDPEANAVEAVVHTGRGPAAIAFDPGVGTNSAGPTNFAYIAHFTDSYLGVLDLDMRHGSTYLTMLATVGVPAAPRESQ